MKAITIADKLVSISRIFIFSVIITLPLNAQAEYYLVYGPPAVVTCGSCQTHRVYYRPVHRVKVYKHKRCYRTTTVRRRSHYSIAVYYPVAVYERRACGCCGCSGFIEPTYYRVREQPYRVYYARPSDRLVGNRYEDNLDDPSLDTGTADNDY